MFGNGNANQSRNTTPRPPVQEERIGQEYQIEVERKTFKAQVRRNSRGCFLRLTEIAHGRADHMIIPLSGTEPFMDMISKCIEDAVRAGAQVDG